MTTEKSYKLREEDKTNVMSHTQHRVLLASPGENMVKTELDDGNYIIFQLGQGHEVPFPVFAFKVNYGNFKITSVYGSDDISNLAAQVDHLRFTSKHKKALQKLNKLRKELDRIEKDILFYINREAKG